VNPHEVVQAKCSALRTHPGPDDGRRLRDAHGKIAQRLMDDMLVELKDPDLAYLPEKLPAFGA
jgi:hypothetical protein